MIETKKKLDHMIFVNYRLFNCFLKRVFSVCLFVRGLTSLCRIFHLYGDVLEESKILCIGSIFQAAWVNAYHLRVKSMADCAVTSSSGSSTPFSITGADPFSGGDPFRAGTCTEGGM